MNGSDHPKGDLLNPPSNQPCDGRELAYVASPTLGEFVVCVLLPGVGLLLGLWARYRGRPAAGSWMMVISVSIIAVISLIPLLFFAVTRLVSHG